MKKHDEGYVMILVLVVMIVMGLVTASILTFSLRNLQNQQLSIERMVDKYAAQGMIEEKLAKLLTGAEAIEIGTEVTIGAAANNRQTITFPLSATVGAASVNCKIQLTCDRVQEENGGYILTGLDEDPVYVYYTITYSTGETEEGGGAA